MAELASLYEKILSARQSAHGSNLKPGSFVAFHCFNRSVVLKWLGADAPYVILYGDFAGENFSVPHLMKCDSEKVWTSTLYLPPGTYHYKFNINGEDKVEESLPREGSNNVIVVQ